MHLTRYASPCCDREKRRASREMAFPGATRAYAGSATTDKTLFPGENTRGTDARRCLGPFDVGYFPARRSGLQSSPKNAIGRNGRCAYARKLRYPPAAAMNFDGSFSLRGAFGRNDADLHYAIYARHSFEIYTWLRS